MRTFTNVSELVDATGEHLGYSEWHPIDQRRIELFADATDDHQWIHVDEQKAAAGPFGSTIAHGFLTLSMISALLPEVYSVGNLAMGMNYGANKIRYLNPVRVNDRIRLGLRLVDTVQTPKGVQTVNEVTIEIEGQERPALVAEILLLMVPAQA